MVDQRSRFRDGKHACKDMCDMSVILHLHSPIGEKGRRRKEGGGWVFSQRVLLISTMLCCQAACWMSLSYERMMMEYLLLQLSGFFPCLSFAPGGFESTYGKRKRL